jgi:hypothetical protein
LLALAGLIGWLIEIAPLLALPMRSVPAVIRSNSASVRPSVPAASAPPRFAPTMPPVVFGFRVTMPVPALITAVGSK